MRTLTHPAAAAALALAAACGDPAGSGPPPEPPPAPAISAVSLTAGGAGVITGTGLDGLPATLTVDGKSVTLTARSATELRFTLPVLRPCETDGRPVTLAIGPLTRSEPLDVPGAIQLNPGESRVLAREELDSCLELAAAPGLYVLTALHPATSGTSTAVDTLLEVRTWTYGAPLAASAAIQAPRTRAALPVPHHARARMAWSNGPFSENPQQFDPRYATAQAGDTLPFVDFEQTSCRATRAEAKTYPVRILAAQGGAVVALDLRMANHAHLLTPEAIAGFQKLAARVDSVLLPATRMIFGADYQPTKGFGGRYVMLLNTRTIRGQGGLVGLAPKITCPISSESIVGTFGIYPEFNVTESSLASLAANFVHEYGHAADYIMGRRLGRDNFGSLGFTSEAFAEMVPETAARLLDGRLTGAQFQQATTRVGPLFTLIPFGAESSPNSPFVGVGRYAEGSSILLYAREISGEATTRTPTQTLHQRLLAAGKWDLSTIASLVGKTPEQLMDEWSLATATDGYSPVGTPLPSFRTWDGVQTVPPNPGSRTVASRYTMAAGAGNFAALYFGDAAAEAGKGVSLQFSRVSSTPSRVRLTCVR